MNFRALVSLITIFTFLLAACGAPNGGAAETPGAVEGVVLEKPITARPTAAETQPNSEVQPAASAPAATKAAPTEAEPATEEAAPASPTARLTDEPIPATTAITSTETVTATEAVTGTQALQGEAVTVEAADGLVLQGSFYAGEGGTPQPGVLLLHMIYGKREQWNPLIPALVEGGYSVLALDMRGHGKTGGEMDWDQAVDDLQRALDYLTQRPEVDPERLGILGASMGANMAMVTAAARSDVQSAALLSPGVSLFGVSIDDDLPQYGPRPLLIVASQGDDYAARSAEKLAGLAEGDVELKLYPGAGHGTNMFAQEDLVPLIIRWLDSTLKVEG